MVWVNHRCQKVDVTEFRLMQHVNKKKIEWVFIHLTLYEKIGIVNDKHSAYKEKKMDFHRLAGSWTGADRDTPTVNYKARTLSAQMRQEWFVNTASKS